MKHQTNQIDTGRTHMASIAQSLGVMLTRYEICDHASGNVAVRFVASAAKHTNLRVKGQVEQANNLIERRMGAPA